MMLGKMMI